MNRNIIGERVRQIRKKELRQTIEEFAEEVGVSKDTITRLENATGNVNNIEVFLRISEVSGHTLDELLLDNKETNEKDKIIRRINYTLNVLSKDELEYINITIKQYVMHHHRDKVNTLGDIKRKNKKKKEIG